MWIDAHAHLASTKITDIDAWIRECRSQNLGHWILGGVDPQDWKNQKALALKYPDEFKLSFGLHPWFVAQNERGVLEEAFELLQKDLAQNPPAALGELGLDFHEKLPQDSHERQIEYFKKQLGLLKQKELPLVLHILKAHDEALSILKAKGKSYEGIVHSYSGDLAQAEQYLALGLKISFSYSVLSRGSWVGEKPGKAFDRLRRVVVSLGPTDFVLETDSPDQPPADRKGELNHPLNLIELAKTVAQIRNEDWKSVLDRSTQNLKKIFYGNRNAQNR